MNPVPSLRTICRGALAAALLGLASDARAALLSGSFSPIATGSNVNLSAIGKVDWVHWGLYTDTSVDRKANVVPQIGDFTVTGISNAFLAAYQYGDNFNGYSWIDGTPVQAVTNTTTGVWAYGAPSLGTSFGLRVPADSNERTLQVFVGVYKGRGTLSASLSDGSAPDYSDASLYNVNNGPCAVYTLRYTAASSGQWLLLKWTLSDLAPGRPTEANVTLQAAALTASGANNPPFVQLDSPANDAAFAAPATITLNATAVDLDGSVSKVEFFHDAIKIGESTTSPFSVSWNDVAPGNYWLTAVATDNLGASSVSQPVPVFVYGTGGSLAGSSAFPPAAVNLTAEGTNDWVHWGLSSSNLVNRRAGVVPLISPLTVLGTNALETYSDNYTAFSWSDGTPTASASGVTRGVFVTGVTNGFRITAPADTTLRQLKVYLGLYGARSDFTAWLSDFSGPPFVDGSLSNFYGNAYAVHTLTYRAASAGQNLVLWYRSAVLYDLQFGNVTLQAVTLTGGSAPTNAPPTVAMTSPTNGAAFLAPATIDLAADAADNDDGVAKVEFFAGSNLLASVTSPPYAFTWPNVPAGNYVLRARATDTYGAVASSAPVNISVSNAPIVVSIVDPRLAGGRFLFSVATEAGQSYTVVRSDLVWPTNWHDVVTFTGNGAFVTFTNAVTNATGFFRVRSP